VKRRRIDVRRTVDFDMAEALLAQAVAIASH